MKRILCYLLVLIMLVSLCGCMGGNDTSDIRGEIIGGNNAPEQEQTEENSAFAFGKATENTYKSEFLGLSCTLPDSWVFYTDQQLLEMNNLVGDYLDEDTAKQLENATIIYDMMAVDQVESSNINVNLEKLSATQLLSLDIQAVLESQFDSVISAYENMGYTDVQVNYEKVTVDGQEFDGIVLTANIQGIDFFARIFSFRRGSYLANVTICSLQTDKTDTILSYFTVK